MCSEESFHKYGKNVKVTRTQGSHKKFKELISIYLLLVDNYLILIYWPRQSLYPQKFKTRHL